MSPSASPYVVEDLAGFICLFSDGTVERTESVFPIPVEDDGSVLWKQVEFESTHKLNVRLYKPRNENSNSTKLPILFYYHGGGFCLGSCSWPQLHNCCLRLASQLNAVVVTPDYRLAPENRLPAAIDDAVSSLGWLRVSAGTDSWLGDVADFDNVFVVGDSSGGTIAHHLAVQFGKGEPAPVLIRGYILLGPFFGGTQRTKSEEDCPKDATLSLDIIDKFWRLSLQVGADADHPFANPFGPESENLEPVGFGPMLIVVAGHDLLRDRAVEYGERLKGWGKPVEVVEFKEEKHGFFTDKPASGAAVKLMGIFKRFLGENIHT